MMQRSVIYLFLQTLYVDEMELEQFHLIHDSRKQQYCLTIPEAVCTVMCS